MLRPIHTLMQLHYWYIDYLLPQLNATSLHLNSLHCRVSMGTEIWALYSSQRRCSGVWTSFTLLDYSLFWIGHTNRIFYFIGTLTWFVVYHSNPVHNTGWFWLKNKSSWTSVKKGKKEIEVLLDIGTKFLRKFQLSRQIYLFLKKYAFFSLCQCIAMLDRSASSATLKLTNLSVQESYDKWK